VRMVEHIGSTAVPGLAAKPIIDVMVTVDHPDDETRYLGPLEDAGYELRVREGGHRMLRTPERDVQVHIWQAGSDDERRQLVFRDPFAVAPSRPRKHMRRSNVLWRARWPDVNYYAEAKGPFIRRVVELC